MGKNSNKSSGKSSGRSEHVRVERTSDGGEKTTSKFSYGNRGHYTGVRKK